MPDPNTPVSEATPVDTATATPVESAEATSAPEPGSEFAGLGAFDDEVDVVDAAALQPEPEAEPAAEAETPTPDAEAAGAEKEAAAAPKPVEAATPEPGTEEVSSSPTEPGTIIEEIQAHEAEILDALAKDTFALSKEEEKAFVDALDQDATQALVEYIPKFGARLYYKAMTATLHHINNLVPQMIGRFLEAQQQHEKLKKAFLGQFPAIDADKHWGDVASFSQTFQTNNPQITQQDLFALVGAAVMAKHGLQAPVKAKTNGGAPPPKPPSAPPFTPARSGAPVTTSVEPEAGPFDGLGEHYDD